MEGRGAWLAYSIVAACLVGSVAWPLWSDSTWWPVGLGVVAALAIAPVIFANAIGGVWNALRRPHSSDHT